MTRKHFQAIADYFAANVKLNANDPTALYALRGLAFDLSATFRTVNPAFDTDKFLKACGVRLVSE